MKKYFIISHGRFAEGCVDTMKIFLGDTCPYIPICAYVDDTPAETLINQALNEVGEEDEVLICSDIMGGSVNQLIMPYLSRPNWHLVAGVNMAALMELALLRDFTQENIRKAVADCADSLVYMNDKAETIIAGSDDE